MKKQIMKLDIPYNGTWRIIQNDKEQSNKFCVYYEANGHRKLIQKYGDIASCLHCVAQQTTGHEWRMTDRKVDRLF